MAYKKVASQVSTVGQLKGILTQFGNKETISLTGIDGFSVAYDEESGSILFDEDTAIQEICGE